MGLTKGTIELDAGESITLKVAQSSITINTEGITITAPMITIGGMTTEEMNITADMINMQMDVNIKGEVNILGNLVAAEAEICGVPGPYLPAEAG
jgi:hypothetical protein